jgi:hypothetical protein
MQRLLPALKAPHIFESSFFSSLLKKITTRAIHSDACEVPEDAQ